MYEVDQSIVNMRYETFIRGAFSIGACNMIGRWGDPAALANTDIFSNGSLEEVKAGVAYSIAVYNRHIFNNADVSENDYNALEQCLKDVINAVDKKSIYTLMENYTTIREKYYTHGWVK